MNPVTRAKLEAAGWAVGTPKDFLHLSEEDAALVDLKVAMAAALRKQRIEQHLSQVDAARRIHSSQSRLAKMEAADPTVSMDLLMKSFLRLGGTRAMIAAALA